MTPDLRPRIQFGIWSDSPVAAEALQERLTEHGQQAVITNGDRDTLIECVVALTRDRPGTGQQAMLTSLANRATIMIAVETAAHSGGGWPRDVSLSWTGQNSDLTTLAADLMNLVRPTGLVFSRLPALLPTDSQPRADSREQLLEQLRGRVRPRVVPVSRALFDDLSGPGKAVSTLDYDLRRLARWTGHERSRSFVKLRLARPEDLTVSRTKPLSLDDVMSDPQTRPLVMLLGEPRSGKSVQLRYYDAHAAMRHIERQPDGPAVPLTFFVALADQPARPTISLDWLRQRWSAAVDVDRVWGFDQFLDDGGTVLLDGLNEGGLRGLEPEQWMSQWRDVIQELYERGAGKVVATCRTRDQAITMRVRDKAPTSVTILPLSREEIIAIATEHDVAMARRLAVALERDPLLVELYSSPVRLHAYLESGASWVATTSTRLFGAELSAAIVREWEQDNHHARLIPGALAGALETSARSNQDPWPTLGTIPLIRALGQLAKHLSLPVSPAGKAPLTMSPGDAGAFLARAIHRLDNSQVRPQDALETAKDLDILRLEGGKIRFVHPAMQHLFAAIGCTTEELVQLAFAEQERSQPAVGAPPSFAHHRYDELFQFAAQLTGVEVPDALLAVDPVLAARVFITIRGEAATETVRQRIITSLRDLLDTVFVPATRAGILAALGDLGWTLPSVGEGGQGATMFVPAKEWQLGKRHDPNSTHSERRTVALGGFRLSRFPVTNAEYAAFIKDGGYEDKSLWPFEGWIWRTRQRARERFVAAWRQRQVRLRQDHPAKTIHLLRTRAATPAEAAALVRFVTMSESEMYEYARALEEQPLAAPAFWHKKALRNPLQPVVGVSWFEANAFCAWLGRRLGAVVRLPSEDEWEAACLHSWDLTGTEQIGEPEQPGFGNTADLNWPATTPIGAFATRTQARRYLAVEMRGNIFEWVFDYYAAGDHGRRILKGGSWLHESWRAHPAYRGRGDVEAQNEDVGFRYVITEGPT
ncbi:hypothetical protein ACTI_60150 [Actinoplanes sp. OR16]|uniref:SUMF1/EgtB/PvdO family nonheme iron enzyme n=1 Tax=Actinoplanes sp. OR16 TaxID=946334 RepID=UPI000F6BC161|nr:SUMF1/EgtB/PvdO family nonheme iron enzyme [Actinoplanes sp. OR16]BBH69330.1 hypothetical protein ACTI_60150 [Actinoplanes sp. OR16]